MLVVVGAILVFGLLALAVVTFRYGVRGAAIGYGAGLLAAALLWPGLMAFAAVRHGWNSAAVAYAMANGHLSALSVGGSWAVCALPVMALAALCALGVRRLRHPRPA